MEREERKMLNEIDHIYDTKIKRENNIVKCVIKYIEIII